MTQGIQHHVASRFVEAAARYSRVVEMHPDHGEAWRLLGVIAMQRGDSTARSLLERAIRIDARDAAAHSALGAVNEIEGKLDCAYAAYESARAIDPRDEAASVGLTRVALKLGRTEEAIAVGEAALASGTVDPSLYRAVGGARLLLRDYRGAADAFEAALKIRPQADAYAYLGGAYAHLNLADAAIIACERALAMDPVHAVATFHLGIARLRQGHIASALTAFEQAVELGSDEAHINLGTLLLSLGNYRRGWPHFGWVTSTRRANPAFQSLPMWDGISSSAHLLICQEQGVGDTIQMVRFIRRARTLVGSLTLACQPETVDLFRSVDGVDNVVDMCAPAPLASFDAWLPTVRLPLIFDVTEQAIPAAPYLHADPRRIERFRPRLGPPGQLRVGLVWAGNPGHLLDDDRSCGLPVLEALHDVPGVTWFALQQGTARADRPENGMALVPINTDVADFSDTAAILMQLDLVITVDTSVAHLAGALGLPAWVLLGQQPDWRWQLAAEVSPWYPSLRLFRRPHDGPWSTVVAAVAAELREFAIRRKRPIPAERVAILPPVR